ncbi:RNA-binding domain-containing protein [Thioalkalivibrio sp. XN279]|uniref:RNA-binding domain-containing protein n=1 Tax=Thioalkalivibrio sp. XN279 TaxID=2714953 RepID=UPI00140ADF05|nr:RNA-binding domain-containing protein [Thioalkalivibrio sp. XN279]NHA14615.1 NACHT domain-containing protein [Thioalkalivibrio sp. XN279]
MVKPVTASQLASRVLKHPRGGLAALLALADGSERDWLEFKAATYPLGGHFKAPENKHDYRWDVARAVIALANTVGGVVLLGVDDSGQPVGIEASDPDRKRDRHGAEAFRRDVVLQQVLHPARGWRTGTEGHIEVVNPGLYERSIELEEFLCGDRVVVAILVKPRPPGFPHILVKRTTHDRSETVVYVRRRGSVGQVRGVAPEDPVVETSDSDPPENFAPEAQRLWDQFLVRLQGPSRAGELETQIFPYLERVKRQLSPFEDFFTPLKGVLREIPSGKRRIDAEAPIPELDEEWLQPKARPSSAGGQDVIGHRASQEDLSRGSVIGLLEGQHRAVLIGEAGSGKSTCLRILALRNAKQWERGRPWPIFASLAQYSTEGLAGLLQRSSGVEWEYLAAGVAEGQVVLYLDALNQCPDSLYENCRNELSNMLVEYPDARVYISTRSTSDVEQLEVPRVEIRSMDSTQQLQFLTAYLLDHGLAADVLEQLRRQPGGDLISGSPILLRIVAEIARESRDIPTGRAALYRRFLEIWCRREMNQARIGGGVFPWSQEQVIDALSLLAFRTRQRGWNTLGIDLARSLLTPILGRDDDRFIDQMAQGFLLTRDETGRSVGFWHETIQEYLCAEYLYARHEDLDSTSLEVYSVTGRSNWGMVLAFAFELIGQPSDALMVAAWKLDPLITTVATRDVKRLASMPFEGDPWTHAVLLALRGEDVSQETMEITVAARLPPKYPISPYLRSTLRSGAFWYSASSHESGILRLRLLQEFVSGGRFPWIELLPDTLSGGSSWSKDLSAAQRLLVEVEPRPSISEVLSVAKVAELCALRRRRKISAESFLSTWENAISEATGAQLEIDLIDILRTEREKVRENVRRMLPNYRAELRRIADDPRLSLRLLSILVRERVVSPREIRGDSERLRAILARMSVMNAIRLARCRVVGRSDLDEHHLTRLLYESSREQLASALEVGLINLEDIPPGLRTGISVLPTKSRSSSGKRGREPRFLLEDLVDITERAGVDRRLRARRWKVHIKWIHPEGSFGFAENDAFDSDIFFLPSAIVSPDGHPLAAGQILDVRLVTRFDRSKERWSFAIDSGQVANES